MLMTVERPTRQTGPVTIELSLPEEVRRTSQIGPLLASWFEMHGRAFPWRLWRDPYRVAIAELMLQRTTAPVVSKVILGFISKYRDWGAIASAEIGQLEADLGTLGLQHRRAQVMSGLARAMTSGQALDLDAPGIGQYIHRAILVGTDDVPLAMVDTNFSRILKRVFLGPWRSDMRYDSRLQSLAAAIITASESPRVANWAIMDIGATVCLPRKPRCGRCPLATVCHLAIDSFSGQNV